MKIVIALACLVAFAAAVEETGQIDADQDVAEHRNGGGHRGGYGGGHHGGRGGGGGHHGGRYGRSLEEAQPVIVAEFQPEYVDYVSDDLQLAENRNYGGNRGQHGSGGYRGRRSVEDENAVAIEDLEAAEHHSGGYRGHSSGGSGYGQSGSYGGSSGGSGYGGQHRGRRSVQEIAGAIEDLEVAEHHSKGYNRGGSSGGSSYRNHGSSSSGYGRPSGGHGSHSGHGGRQY